MTATAHALVGGAIAASIQNPALGIPLAFISHPLLDAIPHWDFGDKWRTKPKIRLFAETAADTIFGVALSYLIFGQNIPLWYFGICVFVSEVWDLIESPYWFLNWKFFPFSHVYKVQSKMQGRAKLPLGIITQIVTVVGITVLLQQLAA